MNTKTKFLAAAAILFAHTAFLFVLTAHAQPADPVAVSVLSTEAAQPFIVALAVKFPWLVSLFAVIATARLVFKPIMTAVEAYVKATPCTGDDVLLDRVEHSTAYRVFAWLLDYLGSIKVGPQRTPTVTMQVTSGS